MDLTVIEAFLISAAVICLEAALFVWYVERQLRKLGRGPK